MIFDPNLVYPADRFGRYQELRGIIINFKDIDILDWVTADVITMEGQYRVYGDRISHLPKVGYQAKIRVYEQGGGDYLDSRLMGWSSRLDSDLEPDLLIWLVMEI